MNYAIIELAHTIATETRQFDHQREAFANQLKDAQQELLEIKHTRHTHEQRIHELDELSRQLLNLNDALVAKLSHSSQANTSLRKLLGITKKVHIPAPTASAKMRHKSPVHTQEEISIKEKALFGDNEIENLQAIHDMYRGLAKSLVETRSPLVSINTDSLKKRLKSARNRKNDPFEKSLSSVKPIQFYLTNQSQSDDPAYDSDETDSALVIAEDLRSASLDRSHREFLNASMRPRSPELERKLNQGPNSLQTLHIKSTTSSPPTDHTYNYNHNNNNHHNIHYQTPNGKNVELVIKSLEDEFESLTTQYRQILATMQQDPDVSRPGLPESSLRNSEQLISVIQQLQRKGEQLRALKT